MYERTGELVQRKFREYLIPTIMTSLAMSLASVVDSVIVGNLLGDEALAAVGLCGPLIFCINFIYMLFGIGGMTCASIARGKREFDKANRAFTLTIVLGLAAMFAFVAGILLFLQPLSIALAAGDEKLASLTAAYLAPEIFTGPGLMFSSGMALFIRTDGKPKISAVIVLVANAVNLILDFVFIALLDTGIAGAGASTSLGYAVGVLIVIPYLRNPNRSFRFTARGKDGAKVLPEILKLGLPKGLVQVTSFLRSLVLNAIIMSLLGSIGMSVMTVCVNVLMISNIFVGGTSDALLPIVGTLYGEKDYYGIRQTMKSAGRVLMVASGALLIFFLAVPQVVGAWFGLTSADAVAVVTPALRMFALYLPFNAANVLYENFYTTTGRSKIASVMATMDGFVFVVAFAFLLAATAGMGFWLCFACSGAATFVLACIWARSIGKKEHLTGMLLLREGGDALETLDVTIHATAEEAGGLSKEVIDFCRANGVSDVTANRLGVCIEEMAVNTAHIAHSSCQGGTIDVYVGISERNIIVRFRDDGSIFDPSTYEAQSLDGCATDGIEVMKRLAQTTEYARQLGFNTTILTFARNAL